MKSMHKKPIEFCLNLSKKQDKKSSWSLVDKIMFDKVLNKATVMAVIKKGWQLNEELDIQELDRLNSIFLFQFNKEENVIGILKGRSWSIQGYLLNLQEWDDLMILKDVDFSKSPF